MSFLAPLFLAGLGALLLPVVFHLMRRRAREKIPFSSLMFLTPSPPQLTRKSRLEHLLLLLFRCVILALLVFAFARPFFRAALPPSAEPAPGKRVLVLVDRSASMQREELWPAALTRTGELLRRLNPQDAAALFLFDTGLAEVMRWEEWSGLPPGQRVQTLLAKLGAAEPGWLASAPGEALLNASEMLAESASNYEGVEGAPMEIWLLSDLAEGGRFDPLQGYAWPANLSVQIEPLTPKQPGNAGIHLVQPLSAFAPGQARVRLTNSRDATRDRFRLHFKLPEGKPPPAPVEVYLPAGQARTFDFPFRLEAGQTVQVTLEGDPHGFDNTLHFHLPGSHLLHVVYLGDEADHDPAQPFFFLQAALAPASEDFLRLEKRALDGPGAFERLEEADLVIAAAPLSASEAERLARVAESGTTLLLLLSGRRTSDETLHLPGFPARPVREAGSSRFALIGEIDFNHPLLAVFADARFSDFTRIHFWGYRRLSEDAIEAATVLSRFDTGDPYLLQRQIGEGNVFVLTSGWQPSDSQLALSTKFVPLLLSFMDYRGALPAQTGFRRTGSALPFPREFAPPLSIVQPDHSVVKVEEGKPVFAEQPGLYTIRSGGQTERVAVNLPPEESQTAPVPLDRFETMGIPLQPDGLGPTLPAVPPVRQAALDLEQRQKVWRWAVLAALAFAALETWWSGRRRPDS